MNDLMTCAWAAVFSALLMVTTAMAQATSGPVEKVPPPSPPYLRAAPDTSGWVIQFESKGEKPAPDSIKEIDVSKSGDARREVTVTNDGKSSEAWFFKGVKLTFDKNAGYAVASDPYQNAAQPATPAEIDFIDFTAAGDLNFTGKTTMAGHACYYYRPNGIAGIYELWIDSQSGLPVAYRDNSNGTQVYTYNTGGGLVTLPPAFLAAYELHQKQMERARQIQAVLTR